MSNRSMFLSLLSAGVFALALSVSAAEDYSQWTKSKDITFNTSSTGLNIPGNVVHFPYVIRLSSKNFTFTEALAGGADIRFAKTDGTPLPYEISMWDAAKQKANIWVRMDTIYGNNSTQKIKMYWGKAGAADSSNSKKVFDTADGFIAVYHLDQASGNAKDATANGLDGVPTKRDGDTLPQQSSGMVGFAQRFSNPIVNYFDMGTSPKLNLGLTNIFTVSAWANHSELGGNGWGWEVFIARFQWVSGDKRGLYMNYKDGAYELQVSNDGTDGNTTKINTGTIFDKQWYYVTSTMNAATIKLYLNDVMKTSAQKSTMLADPSVPFWVGAGDDGQGFNGSVDEVMVSGVVRSDNWIKLAYLNQKGADAPISIKYPQRSYTIKINDFFDAITPEIDGAPDSIVTIPPMPYDIRVNPSDGVISGWAEAPTPRTTYYVRAYNGTAYVEDTISILTYDPANPDTGSTSSKVVPVRASVNPALLGFGKVQGAMKVYFSTGKTSGISKIRFNVYDLKGNCVGSRTVADGSAKSGVQSAEVSTKGSMLRSGVYLVEMSIQKADGKTIKMSKSATVK